MGVKYHNQANKNSHQCIQKQGNWENLRRLQHFP